MDTETVVKQHTVEIHAMSLFFLFGKATKVAYCAM
jgi:hypothetical protein